ncbi:MULTISPECIES: hypothetical protein [Aeromonas]|uniref:hypothetical protein n=1 Tax=Aeromonas TaxID=642 RepID=UPI00264A2B13|nr:hypothetical protein [Aeromonas caviae]MDN6870462.1 hypothetical protein [Aeromonas caviae]
MDAMINILYGIISGIAASFLFELLRKNSNWFPGPSEAPEYVQPALPDEERARNRARLNLAMFNVFFYFYTYFIIYMALLMPPMFKTVFNNNTIYLSDARFIGLFLPKIEIGSSYVQSSFILIALSIYIPLLILVSKLSLPIAAVVDRFKSVNIYRWRGIQCIIFAMFAATLAVFSIYLFNETTLKEAFSTFLAFIALAIAFGASGKK